MGSLKGKVEFVSEYKPLMMNNNLERKLVIHIIIFYDLFIFIPGDTKLATKHKYTKTNERLYILLIYLGTSETWT